MTKQQLPLGNLLINIVIPSIILMKFSGESALGPVFGLLVALAFPIGYGIKELIQEKTWNPLSLLGLISVFLTGGISLLQLPVAWIAIKEASIPFVIGMILLGSMGTKWPLINLFLAQLIDMTQIDKALKNPQKDKKRVQSLINLLSYIISASFFASSALNFALAKAIVQSPPGSEAFNQELGKMTALSFPVIALPSTLILIMGIGLFFWQIYRLTGLDIETLLLHEKQT